MKQSSIFCNLPVALFAVLGIAISFSSDAKADISPEQYEKLKKGAEEVLIVELKSVQEENDNGFKVTVRVEAEIRSVVRSRSNLQPNGTLTFASYYIKQGAQQRGFVGPKSPPQLRAGEIYKVFLSKELSPIPDLLGPAAYGKSFEKVGQAPPRQGAVQRKVAPARALPKAGEMAEVFANPANVMDAERVLAAIPKRTTLMVYSIQQGWAEVEIPGSTQRGWVKVTDLRAAQAGAQGRK